REWDPHELSLAPRVRAHGDVSVGTAGEPRVDGQAEARVARLAVLAEAAGDVERHHHPVALADRADGAADLLDDPQVFVSEHDAGLRRGSALVHVEIGAA